MVTKKGLSEKQKRFADEYIITGTAYSAAIRAGYSEKYAKTNSHIMLENTRIKAYIDKSLEELKKESIADQDEILQFLTNVLRGNETESIPLGIKYKEQALVKKEPDIKDRLRAAELLGKRYVMWTERQQVDFKPVFVEDVPPDEEE